MIIKTRYIYIVDLNPTIGAEIKKERPVLVVQKQSTIRQTVVVLPISSKLLTDSRVEYVIKRDKNNKLYKDSVVIVDQIRAISLQRFSGEVGYISKEAYQEIMQKMLALFYTKIV